MTIQKSHDIILSEKEANLIRLVRRLSRHGKTPMTIYKQDGVPIRVEIEHPSESVML